MKHESYCGCCGTEIQHGDWCLKCSQHLLPANRGLPIWERTYFAQFGKDCPYQEKPARPNHVTEEDR